MRLPGITTLIATFVLSLPVANADNAAKPGPDPTARDYESTWDPHPGEESLILGEKTARFSSLRGRLILQYAGIMPPETGWSDPNTRVYRIVNSVQFFRLNKNKYDFCSKPPKWLAVAPSRYQPDPDGFITVVLLEVDDYLTYKAWREPECMHAPYRFRRR